MWTHTEDRVFRLLARPFTDCLCVRAPTHHHNRVIALVRHLVFFLLRPLRAPRPRRTCWHHVNFMPLDIVPKVISARFRTRMLQTRRYHQPCVLVLLSMLPLPRNPVCSHRPCHTGRQPLLALRVSRGEVRATINQLDVCPTARTLRRASCMQQVLVNLASHADFDMELISLAPQLLQQLHLLPP